MPAIKRNGALGASPIRCAISESINNNKISALSVFSAVK